MSEDKPVFRPVMLVVVDGFGIRDTKHGNAVVQAKTPNYDRWSRELERSIIHTSGEFVGLTRGQMGNSEVGHQSLGSGRVVYQDIAKIDHEIETGMFGNNPKLVEVLEGVKKSGKKLHLVGMVSPGGVHSHSRHLYALLEAAAKRGVNPVVHVITDGRDTPIKSALGYLDALEAKMEELNVGRIATVGGRHYGMDRDNRWDRIKRYWEVMTRKGDNMLTAESAKGAVERGYAEDLYDETIEPTMVGGEDLALEEGDRVLVFNFRSDRARELTEALVSDDFDPSALRRAQGKVSSGWGGAENFELIPNVKVATMTEYKEGLPVTVLYEHEILKNTLAEWLSKKGLTQYHSAETEKYPHVTFFFNGRREEPWPGESRKMVASPKVKSYDLKPEMSAHELTEATLERLEKEADDFVLVNFANADLVGHSGSLEATIKAVEVVDRCAGKLVEKMVGKGGVVMVTADHGNCERMIDEVTGEINTSHTVGPVPLFVMARDDYFDLHMYGKLADVAPTVLDLMGIDKPEEMTGESLIRGVRKIG